MKRFDEDWPPPPETGTGKAFSVASAAAPSEISASSQRGLRNKGLRANAVSLLSNIVFGVASAAPGYSLASALGVIAGFAAFGTPAILAVAFVPMLLIATAYYYLNKSNPDCGTVFTWVTAAMGPHAGWVGGWALIVTNILVIPSLGIITGQYSFALFGYRDPSTLQLTLAGIAWIAAITAICYCGIELSARTQQLLLLIELTILAVFAGAALMQVYGTGAPPESSPVSIHWFNPLTAAKSPNFIQALLTAVFIYWGWDSGVSINEETKNPMTAPGFAAITSTILLVGIYVFVAVAAIAFAGPALLAENSTDVFPAIGERVLGAHLNKLLIIAVLTSAAASATTSILPAARTALAMASAGAMPQIFARVHRRHLTPDIATLAMGGISIAWFVVLTMLSKKVLEDSILGLGLCIAFYYAMTGLACAVTFRRRLFKSWRDFALLGMIPVAGALMMLFLFVKSLFVLSVSGSTSILGLGVPLVVGAGALLTGLILMTVAKYALPLFFQINPSFPDKATDTNN